MTFCYKTYSKHISKLDVTQATGRLDELVSIFGHISFPSVNFSRRRECVTCVHIDCNCECLARTAGSCSVVEERHERIRVSDFYAWKFESIRSRATQYSEKLWRTYVRCETHRRFSIPENKGIIVAWILISLLDQSNYNYIKTQDNGLSVLYVEDLVICC